jgi:cardiolipin synthase
MNGRNFVALCLLFISIHALSPLALAAPAHFGLSPDNSQGLLLSTLNAAKSRIVINIYQFEQPQVLEVLLRKIRSGVSVSILIEGQPFGKVSDSGRKVISDLQNAMKSSSSRSNHLFVMASQMANSNRRFRFDHAKYVVIDGQYALVSSENFTEHGHPVAGQIGNRGWEVCLQTTDISNQLEKIFENDTQLSFGDVTDLASGNDSGNWLEVQPPNRSPEVSRARENPTISLGTGEVRAAQLLTSPNSAPGLSALMLSARSTLEMEEMNLPLYWRGSTDPSPLVAGLIDAARRGVHVRALLNDDGAFGGGGNPTPPDPDGNDGGGITPFEILSALASPDSNKHANEITANYLRQLANSEHLPLEARIVNTRAAGISYIHNKGIIADSQRVLVSSINGTETSVMKNREMGILLDSPDAGKYFGAAFQADWDASSPVGFMP